MNQYSKAIAAAIPVAVLILNQILPAVPDKYKPYVNIAFGVLAVVAVLRAPKNADPEPALPRKA